MQPQPYYQGEPLILPGEEYYPWGATFIAIPNLYITILNDKEPGMYPTIHFTIDKSMRPGRIPSEAGPTATNMDAMVYKSTTSEHYLIRDTYFKDGYARTTYDYWFTSALDIDLSTAQPGDIFTIVDPNGEEAIFERFIDSGVNDDQDFLNSGVTGSTPIGLPKALNHVYMPKEYYAGTGPNTSYQPIIIESPDGGLPLQNGHNENNYGDKFRKLKDYEYVNNSSIYSDEKLNPGPYMPDMDLLGVDDIGIQKPSTDLIDKPIYDDVRPMKYFVKSVPTNFATGADNFTSDKWPTWMVGYTDRLQSATDIVNHFDPANPRDPGDSRYITNYAWHHEPYNWPDGDIYRNGDY